METRELTRRVEIAEDRGGVLGLMSPTLACQRLGRGIHQFGHGSRTCSSRVTSQQVEQPTNVQDQLVVSYGGIVPAYLGGNCGRWIWVDRVGEYSQLMVVVFSYQIVAAVLISGVKVVGKSCRLMFYDKRYRISFCPKGAAENAQ